LKRVMVSAWRTLLREPVRLAREQADRDFESRLDAVKMDLRRAAVTHGHCDICDQDIGQDLGRRLSATVEAIPAPSSLQGLLGFADVDVSGEVRQLVRQIQDLAVEEQHQFDEARDLQAALVDVDAASVRSTQASYAEVSEQLGIVKRGIDEQMR